MGVLILPLNHQWQISVASHPLFIHALENFNPCQVLADIGCGIRPQNFLTAEKIIRVEPHPEYADWLDAYGFKPVRKTALQFLQNTDPIDCVVMFDVIEHMTKDEGEKCLALAKEKAKQVFVFTPNGFHENEGNEREDGLDAWGMNGVEMQRHKSGWTPKDFEGWKVITENTESLLAIWG